MEGIVCRHGGSIFSDGQCLSDVICAETCSRKGSLLVLKFLGISKWREREGGDGLNVYLAWSCFTILHEPDQSVYPSLP
jgi:hypothetical protein